MTEIVLSTISVVELEQGIYRAQSPQRAAKRRRYLETVFATISAEPFTREIGHVVAQVDAEARKQGTVIPFADLLIGGTPLHFGYGLGYAQRTPLPDDPEPSGAFVLGAAI